MDAVRARVLSRWQSPRDRRRGLRWTWRRDAGRPRLGSHPRALARRTAPGSPEVVDVEGSSITALARVGDRLITGGRRGELDAWSLDGRWQRQRLRDATRREPPATGGTGLTSTYQIDSIADICAIPHRGAASVSISGELGLFDAATHFASHAAPGPGSPRSLAAHPDGGALAVGIKQRGIHAPRSIVATVDLAHRSLAQAASRGGAEAFIVLADALETAGASLPILHHLRHHDHALKTCWVVDALVAGQASRPDDEVA